MQHSFLQGADCGCWVCSGLLVQQSPSLQSSSAELLATVAAAQFSSSTVAFSIGPQHHKQFAPLSQIASTMVANRLIQSPPDCECRIFISIGLRNLPQLVANAITFSKRYAGNVQKLAHKFQRSFADLNHVSVDQWIRFLRFQPCAPVDDGSIGAAQVFDKKLMAARGDASVTA